MGVRLQSDQIRGGSKANGEVRQNGRRRFYGASQTSGDRQALRFVRLRQLRRLRECDQVAAVCYRVREGDIEFLLVQTRGGRWTFPKGSAEPGLTHAQAAALEAFEEAGVHGCMEEASFTRYLYRKRSGTRGAATELAVSAHLCEVLRRETPEEANRNPTWFSPKEAKRRLREDHGAGCGAQMARVVDRAVRRIRRSVNERCKIRVMTGSGRAPVIEIDDLRQIAGGARAT